MSEVAPDLQALHRAKIAALWEKNLPIVRERVALLHRAADTAQSNPLSPELQAAAHAAAHKLSGALGMYGYAEAGKIASRLEELLEPENVPDAVELARLAAGLEAVLPL